eukprot:GHUV01003280.1.p1 GENE.GHUV01003280.1~~GHUV01003280.1.p1  ORF type:complete len:548 (+),score=72.75 GHUV01003280.1:218-1861(+)
MGPVRWLVLACWLCGCLAISPSQFKKQHSMHAHEPDYTPEAEADRVNELPGAPNALDFGLFSGYVTVDESAGRALFYVFAEARSSNRHAPLLLWLNGGPGCSSIGGGFMSELGPFYPNKDGKSLQQNPYSWNNMANVLWLESPAFVGFSYSNKTSDAIVGDARTAVDARMFLLKWLQRFPQYAHRDFYISGESYGGHYVPNLAWEIVQGNKRAEAAAAAEGVGVSPGKGYINLKGFFVGNAWTDAYIDNKGALDYWWTHSMIGDESYAAIRDNCDFNTIGPLMRGSEALTLPGTYKISRPQPPSVTNRRDQTLTKKQQQQQDTLDPADQGLGAKLGDQISDLRSQQSDLRSKPSDLRSITSGFEPLGHTRVQGWEGYGSSSTTRFWESEGGPMFSHKNDKEMVCAKWLDIAFKEHGNVNIYEIYADVCPRESAGSSSSNAAQRKYRGALLGYSSPTKPSEQSDTLAHPHRKPRYDPCVDGEVEAYLNLPEVQEALHANQTVKLPWRWTDCTSLINYSRDDLLSSMIPTYRKLLQEGMQTDDLQCFFL